MENFLAYFDLGANGIYIWLAYGASGIVMIALLAVCFLVDARRSDEYKALMQTVSECPRARKSDL